MVAAWLPAALVEADAGWPWQLMALIFFTAFTRLLDRFWSKRAARLSVGSLGDSFTQRRSEGQLALSEASRHSEHWRDPRTAA